jgi:hypothetical protein
MKSKNPNTFWLRWMGLSSLHAVLFTLLWMNNPWLFTQWSGIVGMTFLTSIILSVLQFWAMPVMMRPSAKRWFLASLFGQLLSAGLHSILFLSPPNNLPTIFFFIALALPLALAQSWAFTENFKKAWLFGLAVFLPSLMYLGSDFIVSQFGVFSHDMLYWFLRSAFSGMSLFYLHNYQRKESNRFDAASHERLALHDEEEALSHEETIRLAQQKQS